MCMSLPDRRGPVCSAHSGHLNSNCSCHWDPHRIHLVPVSPLMVSVGMNLLGVHINTYISKGIK